MALSVTFTVCDAQQIGFSSSGVFMSTTQRLAFQQFKRPAQKTPSDLGPLRISDQGLAGRSPLFGSSRDLNGTNCFQYNLVLPICWAEPFSLRPNSCESPRAPPLMDPPTFS